MNMVSRHLIGFSAMLARDPVASKLNNTSLQILAASVAANDPPSQADLCDMLLLTPTIVCRTVQRLEQFGLVLRSRQAEDGRVSLVVPTPLGISLHGRVQTYFQIAKPRTRASAA